MSRTGLVALAVILLSSAQACGGDDGPIDPWALDGGIDTGPRAESPDGGALADVGAPDGAPEDVDPPASAACLELDQIDDTHDECSPLAQDCDRPDLICTLGISSTGSPPDPYAACRPTESEDVLEEGAACGVGMTDCAPGLFCRNQGTSRVCMRLCDTTSGAGCVEGELCRPLFYTARWGTCDDTCQVLE